MVNLESQISLEENVLKLPSLTNDSNNEDMLMETLQYRIACYIHCLSRDQADPYVGKNEEGRNRQTQPKKR